MIGAADVVLLYASDCPNVTEARARLRSALAAAGLSSAWREVDLDATNTPPDWKRFGSPTILVGGADVVPGAVGGGSCCRVYEGLTRAPSVEAIVEALARSKGGSSR